MNEPMLNEPVLNQQMLNPQTLDPEILNLRDIHLPEPVSWWPVAPGWWMILASIFIILAVVFILRKIYLSRQLKRDIFSELENIKQQFQQTQNKSQLAKSLSILLRRASITYYPKADIAGLTGQNWLSYLDDSKPNSSANNSFQSEIGKVLLSAPYLPDDSRSDDGGLDFDAQTLIRLCESWLQSPHKKTLRVQIS